MTSSEKMVKAVHKFYREDEWLNAIFNAVGLCVDGLAAEAEQIMKDLFVSTASESALQRYEKELGIATVQSKSLDDRRSAIIAKWMSSGKVDLEMIRAVANAWKNGEVEVDFADGIIIAKFVGSYGVPTDLDGLKKALDEIKPAHLAVNYLFRYLLIKEVHGAMTLSELQTHKLSEFAGGV